MSYQFLHVYTFSQGGKHTVGKAIGEAFRDEKDSQHVENPVVPVPLFGSRNDIEKAVKNYIENHKDSRGHRLRIDGQILRGDVVSFPVGMPEKDRKAAEKDVIEYYKKKYGKAFRAAVPHSDESHDHLHLFIIPEPDQHFLTIHPGYEAKREIDRKNQLIKKNKTSETKGYANMAYRQAMVGLQDEFYNEIGKKYGLARLGPSRERLEQKAQGILNKANREAEKIKAAAKDEAEKIRAQANEWAKGVAKALQEREEKNNRLINLIKDKLAQSDEGKQILYWIWPKEATKKTTAPAQHLKRPGQEKGQGRG
jgi:hypothetical protein